MKIVLTGGGTGGHFYPLIAVAEEIRAKAEAEKLFDVELYYLSDSPYSTRVLYEHRITFVPVSAGKMRRYFSIKNIFDPFKSLWGVWKALRTVYHLYPDVVFSKGGYASFPTVLASRIFGIPLIIHESDSYPGRANLWAGKFATKVVVSFPEAAKFFKAEKVLIAGNPIRKELLSPIRDGAREFFHFTETNLPVLLIVGGSSGSEKINNAIIEVLPQLVEKYQVVHQTGKNNFEQVKAITMTRLEKSAHRDRYFPTDYLSETATRMGAGLATLIISRGGGMIFEIAAWDTPAIVIPIADSNGDHQRKNAFSYARSGAAIVIEEHNLTPHVLLSEIDRVMQNPSLQDEMRKGAKTFARPEAAKKVADEILKIALQHEK